MAGLFQKQVGASGAADIPSAAVVSSAPDYSQSIEAAGNLASQYMQGRAVDELLNQEATIAIQVDTVNTPTSSGGMESREMDFAIKELGVNNVAAGVRQGKIRKDAGAISVRSRLAQAINKYPEYQDVLIKAANNAIASDFGLGGSGGVRGTIFDDTPEEKFQRSLAEEEVREQVKAQRELQKQADLLGWSPDEVYRMQQQAARAEVRQQELDMHLEQLDLSTNEMMAGIDVGYNESIAGLQIELRGMAANGPLGEDHLTMAARAIDTITLQANTRLDRVLLANPSAREDVQKQRAELQKRRDNFLNNLQDSGGNEWLKKQVEHTKLVSEMAIVQTNPRMFAAIEKFGDTTAESMMREARTIHNKVLSGTPVEQQRLTEAGRLAYDIFGPQGQQNYDTAMDLVTNPQQFSQANELAQKHAFRLGGTVMRKPIPSPQATEPEKQQYKEDVAEVVSFMIDDSVDIAGLPTLNTPAAKAHFKENPQDAAKYKQRIEREVYDATRALVNAGISSNRYEWELARADDGGSMVVLKDKGGVQRVPGTYFTGQIFSRAYEWWNDLQPLNEYQKSVVDDVNAVMNQIYTKAVDYHPDLFRITPDKIVSSLNNSITPPEPEEEVDTRPAASPWGPTPGDRRRGTGASQLPQTPDSVSGADRGVLRGTNELGVTETMNNINWDFIEQEEGFITEANVPDSERSQSGVTIGAGVDLGQWNRGALEDMGVSEGIIEKVAPYLGKKKESAKKALRANPLTLSDAEARELTERVKEEAIKKVEREFDSATQGWSFSELPEGVATAITSVAFQYGDLKSRTPKFWKAITNNNWIEAYRELQDFGDRYPSRRNREAAFLQQSILREIGNQDNG